MHELNVHFKMTTIICFLNGLVAQQQSEFPRSPCFDVLPYHT